MTVTFAGYPEAHGSVSDIAIVGAPCDLGVTGQGGQRMAPYSIRACMDIDEDRTQFRDPITGFEYGKCAIVDHGDIPIVPGDYTQSRTEIEWYLRKKVLPKCNKAIVFGGDDGINLAILEAMAEKFSGPATLVHLDAHTDTYVPTKLRGSLSGRRDHGTWVADAMTDGLVDAVWQVGTRAVGPSAAREKKLPFPITRRDLYGTANAMNTWGDGSHGPILLAIDIDAIDPAYAPGTGFPEPLGLLPHDVAHFIYEVARHVNVFSITEVLPAFDSLGLTSQLASRLTLQYIQHAR